ALRFVNASEFGLTSGLHSLDDREVTRWRERIEVGNAYVNRATTGAIVRRQPFGGWKRSAFGSGAKAGGPNYVLSLGRWRDRADDLAAAEVLRRSRASYQQAWAEHFHQEHDPSQVLGESNILRYRPIRAMVVRAESTTPPHKLRQVEMAAAICGVPLSISLPVGQEIPMGLSGGATITTIVQENESELAQRIHTFERLRHLGAPTDELLTTAHAAHVPVIHEPVTTSGRLELRYYLREQAVSETRHRYGNVIKRDTE
ncbi:MAG: aldehyde dehydrogenase family protein, partial [Caldilineaceae bacterium]|nr:aldehyde dehydrogenase family protein [Caldilineaceae bacterium]